MPSGDLLSWNLKAAFLKFTRSSGNNTIFLIEYENKYQGVIFTFEEFCDCGNGNVYWITDCFLDEGFVKLGLQEVISSINLELFSQKDENDMIGFRWLVREADEFTLGKALLQQGFFQNGDDLLTYNTEIDRDQSDKIVSLMRL